jgi:hypothetical protein
MFELVIRIGEIILGASRLYSNRSRKRRKQDFGKMIVTVYIRLLEIINTGQEILDSLSFLEKTSKDPSQAGWTEFRIERIQRLLREQEVNLTRLAVSANKIADELSILGTEDTSQLLKLVSLKRGVITNLAIIMGSGWIVYDISFDEGLVSEKSEKFLRECRSAAMGSDEGVDMTKLQSQVGGAELIHIVAETDQIEKIRRFLKTKYPRDQLDELRTYARSLHDLIKSHFSIEEVLWSVDQFRS